MTKKPAIHCQSVCPTLQVADVADAVAEYRDQLGFEVDFLWGEPPTHAGVTLGTAMIHFSGGTPNPSGFWIYLTVENVDELCNWYEANNVEIVDRPETYPWGMREFSIRDRNGYVLRFGHWDCTAGDPVPVERKSLEIRLESRLADLLGDLAAHKKMTIGETLEETLLHSFEAVEGKEGQAVASPHTKSTMAFIEQLKQTHGIDYDTHASYRFKES